MLILESNSKAPKPAGGSEFRTFLLRLQSAFYLLFYTADLYTAFSKTVHYFVYLSHLLQGLLSCFIPQTSVFILHRLLYWFWKGVVCAHSPQRLRSWLLNLSHTCTATLQGPDPDSSLLLIRVSCMYVLSSVSGASAWVCWRSAAACLWSQFLFSYRLSAD